MQYTPGHCCLIILLFLDQMYDNNDGFIEFSLKYNNQS